MSYGLKQPNLTNMTAAEYLMSMSPRSYNSLAEQGRNGDTILAHINPREANLLKNLGGSGSVNPNTGLREFYDAAGPDAMGAGGRGEMAGGPSVSGGDSRNKAMADSEAERAREIARSFEEHKAEVQKAEAEARAKPPGRSFGFFNALSSGIEGFLSSFLPGFDPDFDGKSYFSQEVREPGLYFGLPYGLGRLGPQVGATPKGFNVSQGMIADYFSDPDTNVADDLGDLAADFATDVSDFNVSDFATDVATDVSDFTGRFNPGLALEPGERLAASRPQVTTPVADLAREFSEGNRPASIF